jgi:hypothetical protein
MRIYKRARVSSLGFVLEILTPTHAGTAPKGAGRAFSATFAETVREFLPRVLAILTVLIALSIPVLLILWRLHRPYS